jgi:pilus assembly protein CpaF
MGAQENHVDLEARIREKLLSKLERQSRDRQLDLLNQAAFIRRSQRIIDRAHAANQTVALLLGDVDDFAKINNTFGHQTGDDILVGLVALLKQSVGESGLVGRWGGEEFVVLLPNAAEGEAIEMAEEICRRVEDHAFTSEDGRKVRVTISIGVALFPGHGGEIVALVECADRAAYLAKRMGKNRVCLYERPAGLGTMRDQVEELFSAVLAEEGVMLSHGERRRLFESIAADLLGYGPLEPLLADDTVTEILVDGPNRIYVERGGQLQDVPTPFRDDAHLMSAINALIAPFGRKVDASSPYADARLPDGSHVLAVVPPVSSLGPSMTIRKFSKTPLTTENLLHFGTWNEDIVQFLRACVRARLNIFVTGGTGSGKTTLLNVIAGMVPAQERIIIIEGAGELRLPEEFTHLVRLQSRPPDIEGRGEITVRDLVVNAMRMRPDRIVVGEVRAGEADDLLQAMNTGYDGSLTTIHANGSRDALARLETMVVMASPSLPLLHIRQHIASAIDLIIYLERMSDGTRKLLNVTEVVGMQGDVVMLQDLFEFRQTGIEEGRVTGYHTATGAIPRCLNRIRESGIDLPMSLFTPR